MKRITITRSQFARLNEGLSEENIPTIDVEADNFNDVARAGSEAAEKVSGSGMKSAKIRVTPEGASPDDAVELSGQGDTAEEQFSDAAESASDSMANKNSVTFSTVVDSRGTPVRTEGAVYTKKMIEEARLAELNKSSVKFTKGEFRRRMR